MIRFDRAERCVNTVSALTINRPLGGPIMAESQLICLIEDCCNPVAQRGMCNSHYLRWRRHGDPLAGGTSKGEPLRWLKELQENPPSECVPWPFGSNGNGYGWAWYRGRRIGAHRLSLVLKTGKNLSGLHSAHQCHNRICVNPRHLEWETPRKNVGENSKRALTRKEAGEIKSSNLPVKDLAVKYGVSKSLVYKIRQGKVWADE